LIVRLKLRRVGSEELTKGVVGLFCSAQRHRAPKIRGQRISVMFGSRLYGCTLAGVAAVFVAHPVQALALSPRLSRQRERIRTSHVRRERCADAATRWTRPTDGRLLKFVARGGQPAYASRLRLAISAPRIPNFSSNSAAVKGFVRRGRSWSVCGSAQSP